MPANWEVESDKFIFFWGGIFSNWAKAPFKAQLKRGFDQPILDFNTSEQYMMAQKSVVFHDAERLMLIMKSSNPKEQKAYGRQVVGFDIETWAVVARELTYIGVYAKFVQNPKLTELILSTGHKWLIEASPMDNVWGIGLAPNDSTNSDPKNWTGKNWLGQVLMKVRDDIRFSRDSSFTQIDWTPYENERLLNV